MMKKLQLFAITVFVSALPTTALADLGYNSEHEEALNNLQSIESASVNMHYQCGDYSLIISAYATESDVSGRKASVMGRFASEEVVHDISEKLAKGISKRNILSGQMSVACNPDKGAFEIEFTPNKYAPNSVKGRSVMHVFSDGIVVGTTEIVPK